MPSAKSVSPIHPKHVVRRHARFLAAALAGLAAVLSAPAQADSPNRFERLRQQDLRVASVAYRLAISNRDLCGVAIEPQLGFVTHGIGQYQEAARQDARSNFALDDRLGVMAVVPGSPAALAGLAANAGLVSVNGRELGAGADRIPGRAVAEQAEQAIAEELKKGFVTLRVAGSDGDRVVSFAAVLGCSARVELLPSSEVNAWADGERVLITTAMLDQCETDDELALVIAHEMAHNILGHRARLASLGLSGTSRDLMSDAGSAKMQEAEDEADSFAARMATSAGYDLGQAGSFLDRLVRVSGLSTGAAATHSSPSRRLASWSAAASGTGAGLVEL